MATEDPNADSRPEPRRLDVSRPTGVAGDPRERSVVSDPAGKTWFRDLDEAVIESDRCIQCGTCAAACPSDSIGVEEATGRPTLVRMCTGCSRCWDYCPRSGLRYERLIDLLEAERDRDPAHYAARAAPDARAAGQDGGVVTELLASLLEAGGIDGAVVARERADQPLRAEPFLATTRAELLACAGSSYTQTMQLGRIDELLADRAGELPADPRLALVGTPCVIEGAAALERYDDPATSPIALTVALMCTRSFEYDRLFGTLVDCGVDPATVEKVDVTAGVLQAFDAEGDLLLETSVRDFDDAALRGCSECADFVGATADVSAGSVGSEDGYTTVVVRTERGERAWETAAEALESTRIDAPEAIDRLASWNERRARETLPRAYDPDANLGITYEDHREAYADTDRDLEPLNPARVHQYEEWC